MFRFCYFSFLLVHFAVDSLAGNKDFSKPMVVFEKGANILPGGHWNYSRNDFLEANLRDCRSVTVYLQTDALRSGDVYDERLDLYTDQQLDNLPETLLPQAALRASGLGAPRCLKLCNQAAKSISRSKILLEGLLRSCERATKKFC